MYKSCTRLEANLIMSETSTTPAQGPDANELFPIRTVSSLTGVNPITLRAWERRYGLIRPVRTEGGHRLYTQVDIDTIHRAVALLDKGVPIGQVGQALATPTKDRARPADDEPWASFRERMITAISQFDENRLEDLYNEFLALYPSELVTRKALLPLLEALGKRWETSEGSVAEEHFFGVYLRNKLGARFHHRPRNNAGPKLLCACLPGEHHETGLLLFALAAQERGYRLVLLGANMPLPELAYAARRAQADAIVLSGSINPPAGLFAEDLPQLVVAADVPIVVGGLTAVQQRDAIVEAGAEPLGSDVAAGLRRINELLTPAAR